MSSERILRALLAEVLDNAARDRVDEAPEAWGALEKFIRCDEVITFFARASGTALHGYEAHYEVCCMMCR
jgi:hypothetical protein